MHLYRSFAFLMSRMMTENGGYFVCRTRHLVLAGSSRVSYPHRAKKSVDKKIYFLFTFLTFSLKKGKSQKGIGYAILVPF